MNFNRYLHIPERMLIGKKLPKSFFLKNFELSTSEKKLLAEEIDSMDLLANIKPSNSNIPPFEDDTIIYEEIQVVSCTVNGNQLEKVSSKVVNLLQKYIPYPILLLVEDDTSFMVNTCEKRINLNDRSKRTIEESISTPAISKLYINEMNESFFGLLGFEVLDTSNLQTLYSSYSNAILKYQTASITGTFNPRKGVRTDEELQLLHEVERLNLEIQKRTNQLKKETQLNQKVAINIEIQKLRTEIETTKNLLAKI